MYYILKMLVYLPFKLLFPLIKTGRKLLPEGGALLVCNHFSALDIPVLGVNISRKLNFVAKKELFKTGIGKAFFTAMGASPINRERTDIDDMKIVVKKLKQNKYVMLFPEGRRNRNLHSESFEKIKHGAAMFALMSGKPIVPMLLVQRPRLFHINKLIIGEPIRYADYGLQKADRASIAKAGEILRQKMESLLPAQRV